MRKLFFIFYFALIFYPLNTVFAADLKIFDSLGLVRAFSKLSKPGSLTIKVRHGDKPLPAFISLVNEDGLSSDKQLGLQSGNTYKLSGVSGGTWKIMLPDPSFAVEEVLISE